MYRQVLKKIKKKTISFFFPKYFWCRWNGGDVSWDRDTVMLLIGFEEVTIRIPPRA